MTQTTTVGSKQEDIQIKILMLLVHNETQEDKNNFFLIVDDYINHNPQEKSIAASLLFKVYHLNSGTCPSNWMGGQPFIGDDTDPHGIFKFVSARVAPTKEEMYAEFPDTDFNWTDEDSELIIASDLTRHFSAKEIKKFFGVPDTEIVWDCPTTLELTDDCVMATDKMVTYLPGILEMDYTEGEEEEEVTLTDLTSANFVPIPPSWVGSDPTVPEMASPASLLSSGTHSCVCGALDEPEMEGDICPICNNPCVAIQGTVLYQPEPKPLGEPKPGDAVHDISTGQTIIVDGALQAVIDPPPLVLENDPVQPGDENLPRGQLLNSFDEVVDAVGRGLKEPVVYYGAKEKLEFNTAQDPQKHLHDHFMGKTPEQPKEDNVAGSFQLRPGLMIDLIVPDKEDLRALADSMPTVPDDVLKFAAEEAAKNSSRVNVVSRRTVEIVPRKEAAVVPTTAAVAEPAPDTRTKRATVSVELSKRYPYARARAIPNPAKQASQSDAKPATRLEQALAMCIDPAAPIPRPRIDESRGGIPAYNPAFVLPEGVKQEHLGGFAGLIQPGNVKPDDEDGDFEPAEGQINDLK